jgi:hypothetical protein
MAACKSYKTPHLQWHCLGVLLYTYVLRIGECPNNSPFLKNNGTEAHCFP